jgi:hypothetical protein
LAPIDIDLPIAFAWEESSHTQAKADREANFFEKIQHIKQQVYGIL